MKNDPLMLEAFGPCLPTLKVKLFLCGTETEKILLWIMCDAVSGHVKSLSRSVIKNLTLSRVKKIILFFLYSTWGVHLVEMGQKTIFSKELDHPGPKKLAVWSVSLNIVHDFTLFVADIHQIMLISLFLTPFDHFHFHPFSVLISRH